MDRGTIRPVGLLARAKRVWLDVLLYTGLRRGDAVRFGRQHVKDGIGTIKTSNLYGLAAHGGNARRRLPGLYVFPPRQQFDLFRLRLRLTRSDRMLEHNLLGF